MSIVEDLAQDQIPAKVEKLPDGHYGAALYHRDGALMCEHLACADESAAEAWLLVCAGERYPNCYAVRAAAGRAA